MNQFEGYLEWDQEKKEHAIEVILKAYITDYGIITDATEFIEYVKEDIEFDIAYYLEREQYELCTILRDLNNHL